MQRISQGTAIYENYVIERVLGAGGFGITYLALEGDTGNKVAVKEYCPASIAVRENGSDFIVPVKPELFEEFQRGKDRFIREAEIMRKYRFLDGIVLTRECFEKNHTAYIVMDYIEGMSLKDYIALHGSMDYQELMEMMSPIIRSLAVLHRHGVIHRDISPDNLMIGLDNCMYLIDFGAAWDMQSDRSGTVLLTAGYAPPEQYLEDGNQGAWTDVYGLCASMYYALGGGVPCDSISRLQGKTLKPLPDARKEIEPWQWQAMEKGMSMRAADRYRTVAELYDALTIPPSKDQLVTDRGTELHPLLGLQISRLGRMDQENLWKKAGWLFKMSGAVIALAIVIWYFSGRNRQDPFEETGQISSRATEEEHAADSGTRPSVTVAAYDLQETGAFEALSDPQGNGITPEVSGSTETGEQETVSGDVLQTVAENETVRRLCRMPAVTGKKREDAEALIRQQDPDIEIRVTWAGSGQVPEGCVITQNVEPDTVYNAGAISEVLLTVSSGEPKAASAQKESNGRTATTEQQGYKVQSNEEELTHFRLGDVR